MHAYSNHLFASDRRFEAVGFQTLGSVFQPAGIAPFTTGVVCNDWTAPVGARLLLLTSHTHKRGKHFWVDGPGGSRLFDNFDFADPATVVFDPPLAFDSQVSSERRLTYCARYNNGGAADGSPNPATVRRRSVTPSNGVPCAPVACTHGEVGASCNRDAQCDSMPGAGDGRCDACPITAGVTTEDE